MNNCRILKCSPEFFIETCKAFDADTAFTAVKNALPADAKAVRFHALSEQEPFMIGIVVESAEFDEVADGEPIPEHPPIVFRTTYGAT